MLALRVKEHLDVIEHILPGFLACSIGTKCDPLALRQVEEAFSEGTVVKVAWAAHGTLKIVVAQKSCPVDAGELATLIRLDQNLFI